MQLNSEEPGVLPEHICARIFALSLCHLQIDAAFKIFNNINIHLRCALVIQLNSE